MDSLSLLRMAADWGSHVLSESPAYSLFLWLLEMPDSNFSVQPSVKHARPLPELPHDLNGRARIRKATFQDLDRVALVAAAGFCHSSIFQYERPYYDSSTAKDTFQSYKYWFYEQMTDGKHIVIALETEAIGDEHLCEGSRKDGAIQGYYRDYFGQGMSVEGQSVIAGVASIAVPSVEARKYLDSSSVTTGAPKPFASCGSDESGISKTAYQFQTKEKKKEILGGNDQLLKLESLVVHPAYWRKSYGKKLVNWCCQFADAYDQELGVSAAPMSQNMLKQEFKFQGQSVELEQLVFRDKGRKKDTKVEPFSLHIGVRRKFSERGS